MLHADLMPALDQYGVSGLRALPDDDGIVDLELELITNWWATGPERAESDLVRRDLPAAAATTSLNPPTTTSLKKPGQDGSRRRTGQSGQLVRDRKWLV